MPAPIVQFCDQGWPHPSFPISRCAYAEIRKDFRKCLFSAFCQHKLTVLVDLVVHLLSYFQLFWLIVVWLPKYGSMILSGFYSLFLPLYKGTLA
jgi:hypothetical protein